MKEEFDVETVTLTLQQHRADRSIATKAARRGKRVEVRDEQGRLSMRFSPRVDFTQGLTHLVSGETHVTNDVIKMRVGDEDGNHVDVTINSSLSRAELLEAYRRGVDVCGVDLRNNACYCWKNRGSVDDKAIAALVKRGLPVAPAGDTPDVDDGTWFEVQDMDPEDYVSVWMFIARLGEPGLKWRLVKQKEVPVIYVGGAALIT